MLTNIQTDFCTVASTYFLQNNIKLKIQHSQWCDFATIMVQFDAVHLPGNSHHLLSKKFSAKFHGNMK